MFGLHPMLIQLLSAQLLEERLRGRERERRVALARSTRPTARTSGTLRRHLGLALVRLGQALGALGARIASTDLSVGGLP